MLDLLQRILSHLHHGHSARAGSGVRTTCQSTTQLLILELDYTLVCLVTLARALHQPLGRHELLRLVLVVVGDMRGVREVTAALLQQAYIVLLGRCQGDLAELERHLRELTIQHILLRAHLLDVALHVPSSFVDRPLGHSIDERLQSLTLAGLQFALLNRWLLIGSTWQNGCALLGALLHDASGDGAHYSICRVALDQGLLVTLNALSARLADAIRPNLK